MPRLCIVTALPAESRALLDALKLRQVKTRHLRLYSNDEYLLLETGLGKLSAAAGVGAVLQAQSDISGMVNIGIAGGNFDYGTVLAAHHVQDQASGAQWFPHMPENKAFRAVLTAKISTLDAPGKQYQQGILFDMEAAGIFTAASRYLSTSQIHCIKVVSDNPENSIEHITRNSVASLIDQALPTILPMLDIVYEQGLTMGNQHADTVAEFITQTIQGTHHSVNDEQLLGQLVQRHITLTGQLPVIDSQINTAKSMRQTLQNTLDALPFIYGDR